jgi:hypothetical protein
MTAAGALLGLLLSGCVTLDAKVKDAPCGTPVQAVATWQTYVLFGADPTREGASTPGLAGRLYLFGPQADFPLAAPGSVEVRLYPEPPNPAAPEAPLEVWRLDPETLKGTLQRDAIGWGYSLLLPWGTYRPDLTHVRLTVRFDPAKGGTPLSAQETHLTLHGQGPPPILGSTTTARKPAGPVTGPPPAAEPGPAGKQ